MKEGSTFCQLKNKNLLSVKVWELFSRIGIHLKIPLNYDLVVNFQKKTSTCFEQKTERRL
jgi:hypothetical protein